MTHQELQDSVAAWAIGALRGNEIREVEDHLAVCAACRTEAAAFAEVPLALASVGTLETLPQVQRT